MISGIVTHHRMISKDLLFLVITEDGKGTSKSLLLSAFRMKDEKGPRAPESSLYPMGCRVLARPESFLIENSRAGYDTIVLSPTGEGPREFSSLSMRQCWERKALWMGRCEPQVTISLFP